VGILLKRHCSIVSAPDTLSALGIDTRAKSPETNKFINLSVCQTASIPVSAFPFSCIYVLPRHTLSSHRGGEEGESEGEREGKGGKREKGREGGREGGRERSRE